MAVDNEKTQNQNLAKSRDEQIALGSQVIPLMFLTAIFGLNFTSRIIFAPLMPTIEEDLGVGHGEAGSLFLLISMGYFATLLASGFFSSRLLHRRTIITSAIAVGMALLMGASIRNLWGMRFGALLLGMGAGIYLPSGIATLTAIISPKHWGKALAVHELAPNLSFVVAPVAAEILLSRVSWRGTLLFLGWASILLGLAFMLFGKVGNFPGEKLSLKSLKILLRKPSFWIMMALFSLAISSTLGIFAMLPLYLVAEQGIDRNWANTLIALSRISGLGTALLAGWANDHLGPKGTLGGVFLFTGLATALLGVCSGSWVIFIIFLQPMAAVCFFPPGFVALSSIGPPGARNLAVSLIIPFAFLLGGGVIPAGIGFMAEVGRFDLGLILVGILIMFGFILSFYLRLPDKGV